MNFLLEISKEQYNESIINTAGLTETLKFGLQMVLLGMLTVFSVLVLIMLALYLFKAVFAKAPADKKPAAVVAAPAPVATNESALNEEIVAVIAAAIAMAESESDGIKFRVVSFKRK